MNRGALPIVAVLGLGVAMFLPMAVRAGERIEKIEINVDPLPSKDNASGPSYGVCHGYVELRLRLKNSSSDNRVVRLSYPATRDGWAIEGVVATRTVRVAGGQEAAVSLFHPSARVGNEMLEVKVEGVRDGRTIPLPSMRAYRSGDPCPAAVLISRGVPQEFRDQVRSRSSSGTATLALLRSEVPVSQWSTNWLGYSCYDAILLTEKEAEEMPPQVQLAVRRYLECGGVLLIHGWKAPSALAQGGVPDGSGGYFVGLGHVAVSLGGGKADWDATYQKLTGSPLDVYHPQDKPGNLYDLLVAEATVPIRGLFVLVLLFAVGIGPVNLWLLSRYKRRIWLWWNVPAISLLTCLVVFAYSLASEGIRGRGRTASMTVLDERSHRATTIGYLSYYCPLTPSVGPRFSVDTDVTLLETQEEPWRRYLPRRSSTGLRLVDWTDDQHLTSGWVTARVPAYFQIRKNEDRRERLAVEKQADGSVKIVNALGADITRLYWADSSGRIFEGRDIPAGAERTLAAVDTPGKGPLMCDDSKRDQALLRGLFRSEWLRNFAGFACAPMRPETVLSPGCYVAYLDKSPFVESALASVNSEHTAAIVYGISKGQEDGR
jgi:hypothetical protein